MKYNNEQRMNEAKSHIGEVYGDYTIIDLERKSNRKLVYICKCNICGHIQKKTIGEIKRRPMIHSMAVCRSDFLKFISDHSDGDYKYIGETNIKGHRNSFLYKFKCKICGNIRYFSPDQFRVYKYSHSPTVCGDHVYLEEIGKIYDDYKVIKYIGKRNKAGGRGFDPIYLCECQVCHRQKIMQIGNIKEHKGTTHHACSLLLDRDNLPYIDKFEKKWADLRYRTTSEKSDHYSAYGGRGISSEAFKYFIDFFDTMYESFLEHVKLYGIDNTSIERIDVNGDYCPENCKWITKKEQFDNLQSTIYFSATDEYGNTSYYRNLTKYCRDVNSVQRNQTNIFNRLKGKVSNTPLEGYLFKPITKEEYEQNINKIRICEIVSDEEAKELLKKMKEENDNV